MSDTKKEMFEQGKQEWLDEGYEEHELSQCCRCYIVEPFEHLNKKYDELYCENCYDDLFVSWNDAWK